MDRGSEDGAGYLLVIEGADQFQAGPLLGAEDHRAGQWTVEHVARFRAHEARREHELIADDRAVDAQVMTVDLPRPRPFGARLTENRQEVRPLAEVV